MFLKNVGGRVSFKNLRKLIKTSVIATTTGALNTKSVEDAQEPRG